MTNPIYNNTDTFEGTKANEILGSSLSLSGDGKVFVAGGYTYDKSVTITSVGIVRIYRWKEQTTLVPSNSNSIVASTNNVYWEEEHTIEGDILGQQIGANTSISYDGTTIAISTSKIVNNKSAEVRLYKYQMCNWVNIGNLNITDNCNSLSLNSDGTILAIGIPKTSGHNGIVKIYKINNNISTSWETQEIIGNNKDDKFGYSVSLNNIGNNIAIGAPNWHSYNTGYVEVYKSNNTTWENEQKISGVKNGDKFGYSVSLSNNGNRLAIGATGPTLSTYPGEVNIYKKNNTTTWEWEQKISGVNNGDHFGLSVSLSNNGNRLAIGAPNYNNVSGIVSVYNYNGSNYEKISNNILDDINSKNEVKTVRLSGDGEILAVSTPTSTSNITTLYNSGLVKLYYSLSKIKNNWDQVGLQIDGTSVNGEKFGSSISLNKDGTILAVGAPLSDNKRGYVYTYELINNSWEKLEDISGDEHEDYFGYSVSLNDNGYKLAVGAPGPPPGNNQTILGKVGYVNIYNKNNKKWVKENDKKITGDNPGGPDYFGYSISLSGGGNKIVISNLLDTEFELYTFSNSTWDHVTTNLVNNSQTNKKVMVTMSNNYNRVGVLYGTPTSRETKVFDYYNNVWVEKPFEPNTIVDTKLEAISLSQNVNYFAAGKEKEVEIYYYTGGKFVKQVGLLSDCELGTSISLNGDGSIVAISSPDNNFVALYERDNITWTQKGGKLSVNDGNFGHSISLSKDGTKLAIGSPDGYDNGYVRIYNINTIVINDNIIDNNKIDNNKIKKHCCPDNNNVHKNNTLMPHYSNNSKVMRNSTLIKLNANSNGRWKTMTIKEYNEYRCKKYN